jgi:hypothetical protein
LLLKVDTNTRGGTHWFYFKVLNWRPGQTVEFQILNLVRNLNEFYNRGMNIYTRTENSKGTERSEWVASREITWITEAKRTNEIVRNTQDDFVNSYYSSLTFKC